ncbi:MAG TPA: ATP-binding protein, partial [Thermoanaerobaculia bacterium]
GGARDADHLELIRGLGLRSYVIAPMRGKERTRGAITFVYAESGRTYTEADAAFVEELAARAAVALENAEVVRDLIETRRMLEENSSELEMQTEELQFQATHLEEQSTELEMSNAELEATLDQLSRGEALLAEAQSSAHLGSWEWDMVTGAIAWTDEMYRLYGYEPQSVTIDFERYLAGIHPDDRVVAQEAIQEAMRTNGSFVFEHRTVAADGDERVLHCRGRVITDDESRPLRMTGSAQDVTERRAAEEAIRRAHADMERANRAKSDFLASMSHELRTPLNAIGGHVELIAIGIHGPVTDAQRNSLERIRASQEHLLGLINDILQFAKVEAGRLQYRMADLEIKGILTDVVGMLEPQARKRGLELVNACDDEKVTVRADQDRTQQVLINLIGNAIKFTEQGGIVTVECERESDFARVRVTDTGRGIAPEDLESIFDPFVQVRSNRADAPQGVGLGLAISRDLAQAMGGDLTVESRLGVGSVFTLHLPVA